MPLVGFSELHKHANDHGYGLVAVNISSIAIARGVIQCASDQDAPLVLSVSSRERLREITPSLESMARRARNPISLLAKHIHNDEQATLAIRSGCNALALDETLSETAVSELGALAASCGIHVIEQKEFSGPLVEIDDELESATLDATRGVFSSWQSMDATVAEVASNYLREVFDKTGASGQGTDALENCAPWRPVEHLIVYNTTVDDKTSAELAAEGRRVLDRIPGVRATWSGRALKSDASYRWCWLIRFTHTAVIDSYRDHPDHVAYADNHFRPIAGDRISIDYELVGPEEHDA